MKNYTLQNEKLWLWKALVNSLKGQARDWEKNSRKPYIQQGTIIGTTKELSNYFLRHKPVSLKTNKKLGVGTHDNLFNIISY